MKKRRDCFTSFLSVFSLFLVVMFVPFIVLAEDAVTLEIRNEIDNTILFPKPSDETQLHTEVVIKAGDTAISALLKTGLKVVHAKKNDGLTNFTYIISIDGLEEYTNGPRSGWVYEVNNKRPEIYPEFYKLQKGDHLVWAYLIDY